MADSDNIGHTIFRANSTFLRALVSYSVAAVDSIDPTVLSSGDIFPASSFSSLIRIWFLRSHRSFIARRSNGRAALTRSLLESHVYEDLDSTEIHFVFVRVVAPRRRVSLLRNY